jgi:metal-sulfur cluster biosynthetic enzyme
MTVPSNDLAGQIREALRAVIDPELGHNIVDLGFIYDLTVENGGVAHITITTTTRGCPATGFLKEGAANAAWSVPGIEFVNVKLSYDPPWRPDMMTPEAKADLGFANRRN